MADKMSGAETCGTRHQGVEVALEADALYIRISRNQILGIRFFPCVILADNFIEELLSEAKELAEWQPCLPTSSELWTTQAIPPLMWNTSTAGSKASTCLFGRQEESGQDSWVLHQRNLR
jgi:hypothetical protein